MKIETTVTSTERRHSLAYGIITGTAQLGHCNCCHSVFDIDTYRNTQFYIFDTSLRRNKIKSYLTVSNPYVFGMEISFIYRICIESDSFLQLGIQFFGQPVMQYQVAPFLY